MKTRISFLNDWLLVVIAALLLFHFLPVQAQKVLNSVEDFEDDWPIISSTSTDRYFGMVFDCTLTASQLKNAPKWDAEKTIPPLSPKRAKEIALEQAQKDMGSEWIVIEVSLVQYLLFEADQNRWYYKADLKRSVQGSSPRTTDAVVFITMDGKAAPYVERKPKAKKAE